ncbi:MAG: hydrogenase, partial [Deltaproteobacteria bacterium]|nr:hydrogenase [Deltaproteobacteria bacterium]
MSQEFELSYGEIDYTVLGSLRRPSSGYWLLVGALVLGVVAGAICWAYQIAVGIGAGGQNIP